MLKEFTCILCPRGCSIEADIEADCSAQELELALGAASGSGCGKGLAYARQEALNPMRGFSTLVKVAEGKTPLASVRLTKPIPKARIGEALSIVQGMELTAPVKAGQCLVKNIVGCESDVIATRAVPRMRGSRGIR